MPRIIFIGGIDTDTGKTLTACALSAYFHAQGLTAKYLKPFQTGHQSDWDGQRLHENHPYFWTHTHPGAPYECITYFGASPFQFDHLLSWFQAEGLACSQDIVLVEGCGGLLVPLTSELSLMNFLEQFPKIEIILVSHLRLGTINHTLHSIRTIQQLKNPFLGIVYFGDGNERNMPMIESLSGVKTLGRVKVINQEPRFEGHI